MSCRSVTVELGFRRSSFGKQMASVRTVRLEHRQDGGWVREDHVSCTGF